VLAVVMVSDIGENIQPFSEGAVDSISVTLGRGIHWIPIPSVGRFPRNHRLESVHTVCRQGVSALLIKISEKSEESDLCLLLYPAKGCEAGVFVQDVHTHKSDAAHEIHLPCYWARGVFLVDVSQDTLRVVGPP
jgi:hypothetical protein